MIVYYQQNHQVISKNVKILSDTRYIRRWQLLISDSLEHRHVKFVCNKLDITNITAIMKERNNGTKLYIEWWWYPELAGPNAWWLKQA